jgi:hypothetical protein
MTATPAEFVASLSTAFPGAVTDGTGSVELAGDAARLRFAFTPIAPLRLGALNLARMEVVVSVVAGDAAAAQALLEAVDRATQRGGG